MPHVDFLRRVLVGLTVAGAVIAGGWIAAVNMIDARLIVAGRVTDSAGSAVSDIPVEVRVGNRTVARRTAANGCFFVGMTTTFLEHEAFVSVGDAHPRPFRSPGRHFLEWSRDARGSWAARSIDGARYSALCRPLTKPSRRGS